MLCAAAQTRVVVMHPIRQTEVPARLELDVLDPSVTHGPPKTIANLVGASEE